MTYTPKAQRLMKLSRRAAQLEAIAFLSGNDKRAEHFMRRMFLFTMLAHQAQFGAC